MTGIWLKLSDYDSLDTFPFLFGYSEASFAIVLLVLC
jgi:hypothetical protein